MNTKENLKQLNKLFGSYRAEWLRGKIYDYFAEPSYFTALQDNRPCVLEGGRGSGKTTVLRGLSYQGQFALHKNEIARLDQSDYVGIYHKVDTNHVRAFTGGGLSDDDWSKYFVHYFNLIICRKILQFVAWHREHSPGDERLGRQSCMLIARSIHLSDALVDLDLLIEALDYAMFSFQARINNIADGDRTLLSMAGDPIRITAEHTLALAQFKDKIFYFLLDEYENYTDYQQQAINTLIKHTSTELYTFKIGVRELGWRVKHTLNPDELLNDPADYELVNIERKLTEESHFMEFAKTVCQQRIMQIISDSDQRNNYDIETALGNLSIEEEAELLEVSNTEYWDEVECLPKPLYEKLDGKPQLYGFFLAYWARWHGKQLPEVIEDSERLPAVWGTRYENYKYDMLFKIRKGRGSVGIQKYYCGWNTYTKLAAGNIRYLMELVYRAYEKHLGSSDIVEEKVNFKDQTLAAQDIGKKNLMELEGHWKSGAQLTKLLLGLGRIFQVLARDKGKHAPEVNQYSIENSESISNECRELLAAAVMNLALVRSSGNKLDSVTHTRDYIYMIHPIYSPFFVFSHRRKRKLILRQDDVLGLINNPKKTIQSVLKNRNVKIGDDHELPAQMNLFAEFYDA